MRRRLPLLILGLSTLAALVVGLLIGGSPPATLLADAGPFIGWTAPIVGGLGHLAAAATIGPPVLAGFAIPRASKDYERVVALAAAAAAAWTVLALADAVLAYAQAITAASRVDAAFTNALWTYLSGTGEGQARAWSVACIAIVAVVLAVARSYRGIAAAAILSAAALVPLAGVSHAGGGDHDIAWAAMFLHTLFAAVWVGGLLALAVSSRTAVLAERFSTIAFAAFIIVGAAGLVSASLRLDGAERLATPYGTILLVKTAALVALGVIGAVHRRRAIRRLPDGIAFARLIGAELVLMGVAVGMAGALADTAPPRGPAPVGTTPAEILTGSPLPPEPSAWRYLVGPPEPDLLWLAICVALAGGYLVGVRRLRRRGDRWPLWRTVSWLLGLLVLAWATSGGLNAYHDKLLSAHLLQQTVIALVIPVLLVPGAPITLALRTIARRDDGSRGPREWLLAVVRSPVARVLGNAYVAAGVLVASLWALCLTPMLRWATTTHLGHEWMIAHLLLSGCLFVQALIGTGPAPRRPSWSVRFVLLLGAMAMHALLGLAMMTSTALLLADWYGAMGWDFGVTALEDQQRAAGIVWAVAALPTLALAVNILVQWARSGGRERPRRDRQRGDATAEVAAYNAMLARRTTAERDPDGPRP